MEGEVLSVLKEIRDEAKQTNLRLANVETRLTAVVDEVARVGKRQVESEMRLATEVVSLAAVTGEVRDLLAGKLSDHERRLLQLEKSRT